MGIAVVGLLLFIGGLVTRGLNEQTSSRNNLKPASWLMMVAGPLLVIIGLLVSTIVLVNAGYVAVRLRLGATAGQLSQGMHFIAPGIDRIVLLETRMQKEETRATAASRDLQTVTTDLALNFRIDPSKAANLYEQVGTEYKARIIDPAVQEAIKVVTAQYTAEDLIRQRQKVKDDVESELTNRLAQYHLIVPNDGLSITNFDFSPDFNRAIEAKQVAQQQAEQQKFILQRAQLEKETKIAQAQGEAEAAKLNAESLRAAGGELVVAREWITKWDGKLPQVAGAGNFMIDLKSLLQSSGG
ncbi:prohibitin family protein [Kamptonema cortianum]|nr:prohibitin family protein [Geitlerinema splendidum]MDK3157583.1 prohibitin family protein [Kamptonema cortianum]